MNQSPLGAAALAGTGFPIDRQMTAQALGFDAPTRNSLDSVASRDFAAEFLFCLAMCATHLSRFAEEVVIWTNPRSEEHTSELQSRQYLVCRLLLEKKKKIK